jgi:hypothetical protein
MDAVTVLVEQTQIAPHRVLGGLSAILPLSVREGLPVVRPELSASSNEAFPIYTNGFRTLLRFHFSE